MSKIEPFAWKKRRVKEQTPIALHWIRMSACGQYRVVRSEHSWGDGVLFVAMVRRKNRWSDDPRMWWDILSRHHSENAAQQACEKDAKEKRKPQKSAPRRT